MTSSPAGVSAARMPSPIRGKYVESSLAGAISSICIRRVYHELLRGRETRVLVAASARVEPLVAARTTWSCWLSGDALFAGARRARECRPRDDARPSPGGNPGPACAARGMRVSGGVLQRPLPRDRLDGPQG